MEEINETSEIIETGEFEDAKMILGANTNIFKTGIIRVGVKIPKKNCTPQEKTKFKQLENEGVPYDEIDKAIGGTPESAKSKLFPTNVDYFTLRNCDFKDPADAQFIRDNFADEDGHVRKIPFWLPTGDISMAIPHNHKAFDGGSNVRAFTFYDGEVLMLKYVPKNTAIEGKPKPSDWVTVVYDDCKIPVDAPYGIKFGGMYKINIVGIPGAGELAVPTHSWYGIDNAIAVLRRVRSVLGRFHGLLDGKMFLVLKKTLETVKAPDGKRQKQWLTTIDTSVDLSTLAIHASNRVSRGIIALNRFNGATNTANQPASPVSPTPTTNNPLPEKQSFKEQPIVPNELVNNQTKSATSNSNERQDTVDQLYKLAAANGLTDLELEAYGNFKLRAPIATEQDASRLKKLMAELEMRLAADKNAVKARCQDLLKDVPTAHANTKGTAKKDLLTISDDLEIQGMLNEFECLANKNDIIYEHLLAHLALLSGGTLPSAMQLPQLQTAYKEIENRIKRGNVDDLKKEFLGNFRSLTS